jgi:four helix bundle protein
MVGHYRELRVYQQGFRSACRVFQESRAWPVEERYALTDQARRASRSVCANIAEAWAKRLYVRHFTNKLTNAYGEAEETRVWLDFAHEHGYMRAANHAELSDEYRILCGGLVRMINSPESWCFRSRALARPESASADD